MARGGMVKIQEPLKGYPMEFGLVPVDRIQVPTIQRELSDTLVERLAASIEKAGFVEPVLLIRSQRGFEVINGHHRLEAARRIGLDRIPAMVLPEHLKHYIISLNVEKAPNIRDRAHQAYEIFQEHVQKHPDQKEVELMELVEQPYYLTIGFVTDGLGEHRFPAYAFEEVLRRVDTFLEAPLVQAQKERERRAQLLLKVREVLEKRVQELQLTQAMHKHLLVLRAFQNLYGKRVRRLDVDFDTVFHDLIEEIPQVQLAPSELSPLGNLAVTTH